MSPSAAPPSPQEIQRKLSVHSVHRSTKPPPVSVPPVSGTESDSDSILTPDAWSISPFGLTGPNQHGLSSIAERRSGSGEDSEDEDDEGEGGWKTAENNEKGLASFDESVIKTGYLWKKGERRKTWKKRWFVLRPAHLAYYKTAAEYQLLRLLDLSDVHSCTKVSLKRHDNAFGLVSPVRTFYLQAKTPEEVQGWVQAIEDVRQTLTSQSSGSAPIPIPRPQRSNSLVPAITPSPPSQLHCVTSSDSDDASPTSHQMIPPFTHQAPTAVSPSKAHPAAQKDPSKTILSGYLMKCGSKRRNWHKRWFVLTGEKLMYSASHMDTKPHRQFPYSDILDALEYDIPPHRHHPAPVSSPPVESDNSDRAHTFKIVTTKKTLLVCAPSEEDEITWLGAIRALIARRAAGDVSPNSSGFTSSGGSSGLKAKVRRLSASAAPGISARPEESAPKQS